jgi:hypothetical protein
MPADGRAGAGAGAARLETNRADDARFATVCCACPRRVLYVYMCAYRSSLLGTFEGTFVYLYCTKVQYVYEGTVHVRVPSYSVC